MVFSVNVMFLFETGPMNYRQYNFNCNFVNENWIILILFYWSLFSVDTVDTDGLVLKQQGIISHSAQYASMSFHLYRGKWLSSFMPSSISQVAGSDPAVVDGPLFSSLLGHQPAEEAITMRGGGSTAPDERPASLPSEQGSQQGPPTTPGGARWTLIKISNTRTKWPIYCLECRADSKFAPSQWETALLYNDVSHWLGTNLESAPEFDNKQRQSNRLDWTCKDTPCIILTGKLLVICWWKWLQNAVSL